MLQHRKVGYWDPKIVYYAPREKKFYFLLAGHKVNFIAPCGANKSIFSTKGSKSGLYCPLRGKKIHF